MNKEIEKLFDEMTTELGLMVCQGKDPKGFKTFVDTHFIAKSDLKEAIEEMKTGLRNPFDYMNKKYNKDYNQALQDLTDELL